MQFSGKWIIHVTPLDLIPTRLGLRLAICLTKELFWCLKFKKWPLTALPQRYFRPSSTDSEGGNVALLRLRHHSHWIVPNAHIELIPASSPSMGISGASDVTGTRISSVPVHITQRICPHRPWSANLSSPSLATVSPLAFESQMVFVTFDSAASFFPGFPNNLLPLSLSWLHFCPV